MIFSFIHLDSSKQTIMIGNTQIFEYIIELRNLQNWHYFILLHFIVTQIWCDCEIVCWFE